MEHHTLSFKSRHQYDFECVLERYFDLVDRYFIFVRILNYSKVFVHLIFFFLSNSVDRTFIFHGPLIIFKLQSAGRYVLSWLPIQMS